MEWNILTYWLIEWDAKSAGVENVVIPTSNFTYLDDYGDFSFVQSGCVLGNAFEFGFSHEPHSGHGQIYPLGHGVIDALVHGEFVITV